MKKNAHCGYPASVCRNLPSPAGGRPMLVSHLCSLVAATLQSLSAPIKPRQQSRRSPKTASPGALTRIIRAKCLVLLVSGPLTCHFRAKCPVLLTFGPPTCLFRAKCLVLLGFCDASHGGGAANRWQGTAKGQRGSWGQRRRGQRRRRGNDRGGRGGKEAAEKRRSGDDGATLSAEKRRGGEAERRRGYSS